MSEETPNEPFKPLPPRKRKAGLWARVGISALLIAGLVIALVKRVEHLEATKPTAETVEAPKALLVVRAREAVPQDYVPEMTAQGEIRASRNTRVASEVAGKVAEVAPKFHAGESFEEDEAMLKIDEADYHARLADAEAAVADAKLALDQEIALARQAKLDWEELSPGKEPTDLALRIPQRKSAEARIKSAEASVEQARRDIERASIRAPFRGRIREVFTEKGSYLTPGSVVADFYSTGVYEVRLPVSLEDTASLPEGGLDCVLRLRLNEQVKEWNGTIVRREGVMDRDTWSVALVAEMNAPDDDPWVRPGLIVTAEFMGRTLKNVTPVPRSSFLDENRVYVVTPENRLAFRDVKVVRREDKVAWVAEGLKSGDRICLTRIAEPFAGLEVSVEP